MRWNVAGVLLYLFAAAGAFSAERAAAPSIDLFAEPGAWASWAPREEIAPQFFRSVSESGGGRPEFAISSKGDPYACGCWQRALPRLEEGRRYRIEATFRGEGFGVAGNEVWALVTRRRGLYMELDLAPAPEDTHRMAATLVPERDLDDLALRLCLAWSPKGAVYWTGARLTDVTELPVKRRIVRLAAVAGGPPRFASPAAAVDYYCRRLDVAGRQGADLVVLTENINIHGVQSREGEEPAEPIPGPSTRRLAEQARKYKMYVAASLAERDGRRIYNTGVLIDRSGRIAGKYRKTHLTIGEGLLDGRTPGEDLPVFDTDFGRVGYMICYDNHFPEVARVLALKGAEILLYSNAGDGREAYTMWEPYIRTRAFDNQVFIVAAQRSSRAGRTCIVSRRGEILAKAEATPGAIAIATCDLDLFGRDSTRRPIFRRYLRVRRPGLFGILSRHYWDLLVESVGGEP